MDRLRAVDRKTRALERMLIHGRRSLSALAGLEEGAVEAEVLTRLAAELDAQDDLLDECRRLDEALPADRDQWAAWLETLPPESRRSAERALDDLTRMADEAARVEAQVSRRLGRLRDEVRQKLDRVRAGHRVVKAYHQPRPSVPRIVDRQE
ncbi:MAG: hypothetical protein KJ621_13100 [Proteobacteria bacterium]|nr:hypothetical protein [Pseudomonadota bacterium]MBU1741393.1 hypothetical protein [Pseudomonadota bacterium]